MKTKNKIKPGPFANIVVGVDFSNYSKIVVKQARQIAQQMNAKLTLVHATYENNWQASSAGLYIPPVDTEEVKKSMENFYQLKPSDKVFLEVKKGFPSDVVIAVAQDLLSSLIIVGSQGSGAVSRFILGSNAEKIALRSSVPVWVHRGRKIVPFHRVLVPTDLSNSSHKLITKMKKWSDQMKMSMSYLYVRPEVRPILNSPEYQLIKQRLQRDIKTAIRQFKQKGLNVSLSTTMTGDPSEKISALGKKYDVIAMNPHHRSGLLQRFGRITSKVIRLSDSPVLVVKS